MHMMEIRHEKMNFDLITKGRKTKISVTVKRNKSRINGQSESEKTLYRKKEKRDYHVLIEKEKNEKS